MSGLMRTKNVVRTGDVVRLSVDIYSADSVLIALQDESVTILSHDENGRLVETLDNRKSFYVDDYEIRK